MVPSKDVEPLPPTVSSAAPRSTRVPLASLDSRPARVWKLMPVRSSVAPFESVTTVAAGRRLPMPAPVLNHFFAR